MQAGGGVPVRSLVQVLLHGGAEGLQVLEGAQVLGPVVAQLGHLLAPDVLHQDLVAQGLAGQGRVGVPGLVGDGEGLPLVSLEPQQLGVEGPGPVDLEDLVRIGLGLEALGLHPDVAGGHQARRHGTPLHGQELGAADPQRLQVLRHGGIVDEALLAGQGDALVVGQGDLGGHVELGPEHGVGTFLQVQLLQSGPGDRRRTRGLGGGPEVALHQLLGHFGLDLPAVGLQQHLPGGLPGPEAPDLGLGRDAGHHVREGEAHFGGGHRHFDGLAGGGLVVEGGGHGNSWGGMGQGGAGVGQGGANGRTRTDMV